MLCIENQWARRIRGFLARRPWILVVLAVAARAALMARAHWAFDDPDNYRPLARSLARGEGFVLKGRATAYRPPLYPLMLAPAALLDDRWERGATAFLHLALGAGTVALTFVAAERFGLSRGRAWLASAIVAFDPVLAGQCRSVMTETPAAFLVAATLAGLSFGGPRGACLGGIGFGLSGLCRPSLLAGAALTCAAALIAPPGGWKRRATRACALAAVAALVLVPWMLRNLAVFGEPVWTTTHGGYTLALANNPVYYREVLDGPPGRVWTGRDQWLWWDSVNRQTHGMGELRADRDLRDQVWKLARRRPGDFLRASLARLQHFFSVAPAPEVYPRAVRLATFVWTVPLWIATIWGLACRSGWHWPRIAAPMIVLGLVLVHTVFWTDLRMRAPIVPAIALIAASSAAKSTTNAKNGAADGAGAVAARREAAHRSEPKPAAPSDDG